MILNTDVIGRLENLGVVVSLTQGDRIMIDPADAVPPSLKAEIKAHRDEVVDSLRIRGWVSQWRLFMAELHAGLDVYMQDDCRVEVESCWVATLNIVEYIEVDVLRNTLGFIGCPAEEGVCDLGWPMVCGYCAELKQELEA
jgi:hypothetical protein